MSWTLVERQTEAGRSRWRVVDDAGQEVSWINDYLDAQCLRALSPLTLRSYAHLLLHFARWWSARAENWSEPDRGAMHDYVRFQLGQHPMPSAATINARLELVRRLCRYHFGSDDAVDPRMRRAFWMRSRFGYGRPQREWVELRLKQVQPVIVPLTREEVARFWASFRTCRDMALVGLMLLSGLRSRETLTLKVEDVSFSEAQLRVYGKGKRERLLPLPPETLRLIDLYLRTERPETSSTPLFLTLKGKARGRPMTPAGLRSLFRYHRITSDVPRGNPHRFRHTFGADMVRAGVSLPALMRLMGHADIETTMRYVQLTPEDVWREYARAVQSKIAQNLRP